MPDVQHLTAFALAAVTIALIPGPGASTCLRAAWVVFLNTLVDVVVAFGAGRISDRLVARPRLWRRQQIATGSLLVGLGVYAAASGHRTSA